MPWQFFCTSFSFTSNIYYMHYIIWSGSAYCLTEIHCWSSSVRNKQHGVDEWNFQTLTIFIIFFLILFTFFSSYSSSDETVKTRSASITEQLSTVSSNKRHKFFPHIYQSDNSSIILNKDWNQFRRRFPSPIMFIDKTAWLCFIWPSSSWLNS